MQQLACYNCFHIKPAEGTCPFCGYDPGRDERKYPFALKPGSTLANRYVLGRVLGQGGFGVTYVALDHITRSRIAIKEYLPSEMAMRHPGRSQLSVYSEDLRSDYEYGKNQFLAEAEILSKFVGNEHIVGIQDIFEENATAYFAMEYMEGVTLKQQLLESGQPLSVSDANRILLPIMEALDWVHSKGIIHRDISPDNIMMRSDGTAKLIDFGAARNSTGEKSKSLDIILKHGFAPIEQYTRRGRQGPFTDVYAMAATYYYTITGKVPPDAIERSEKDELIPPSKLNVRIPQKMEEVLLKALSVNASDRFQTMADFYQMMMASMTASVDAYQKTVITTDIDQTIRKDNAVKKKKGRLTAVIATVGVLAAAILGFYLMNRRVPPSPAVTLSPEVESPSPEPAEPKPVITLSPSPEPMPETPPEPEEPSVLPGITLIAGDFSTPGSIVSFGSYEQDNDMENGSEPLEWQILDMNGNTRLLISRNTLDCQPFNTGGNAASVTWETSTLRSWLNDEFFESAFLPEDQAAILLTTVNNNHRQAYTDFRAADVPDTEDRLFLLSYAEAWKYFQIDQDRTCDSSRYASSQGVYVNKDNKNSPWWLRSLGNGKGYASFVYTDGTLWSGPVNSAYYGSVSPAGSNRVMSDGTLWYQTEHGFASASEVGIRPALWIDLDLLGVDLSAEAADSGTEHPADPDLAEAGEAEFGAVGSLVTYGHYEQDNDPDNGKEEIEWIVLDTDGDRRLLISRYGLCRHKYHPYTDEVLWETTGIREWLNSEFYSDAFSPEEQSNILPTVVDNSREQWFHQVYDGSKTVDKLFFLSYQELIHYFPTVESRICENTPYAISQKRARVEYWWLRSPGGRLQFAECITDKGKRVEITVTNDENFVRPVMWIELEALRGEKANLRTYNPLDFKEVGNIVRFGQYEQDNSEENGKENIDWLVLDTYGDYSLLISLCGLDKLPYHTPKVEMMWEGSDLRTWLNGDFYDAAFDTEEKQAIVTTTVDNSKSQWYYDVRPGNNTEDKLFLMSYREAWSFFWSEYERTCAPTAYANAKETANTHEWWLRSPGKTYFDADIVDGNGLHYELPSLRKTILVRPMMVVDLSSPIFQR
ncbi:MAG: serine/threonine protein kinase [Oscillospiraceae bacterium]|nr:serine/threonine protein kinase [Oscillospiraceae bacterium]